MAGKAPSDPGTTRRRILACAGSAALAGALPARAQQAPAATSVPVARPDGVPSFHLAAQPSAAELLAGKETPLWSFGRRAPGPELRLKAGDELRARLSNGTGLPLSLHWHGMRIDNAQDGVAGLTQPAVAPSSVAELRFTPPDAGTFIYRPLVIGSASEQTDRGLAGVAVVEEANPLPVDLDVVLAVDDWRLGATGDHEPFGAVQERAGIGRLGTVITVNGAPAPARLAAPPGARIRLRLVSLCNARLLRIRFDGVKAHVVAVDSQPTDTFEPLRSTLPFAPGARYDVIVETPAEPGPAGSVVALVGPGLTLLAIEAQGEPANRRRPAFPPLAPLPQNAKLPPAIALQKAQRTDLVIEGGARPGSGGLEYKGDPQRIWTINGVHGAVTPEKTGKPLLSVKRGTPVVMTAINRTSFVQELHLHGHTARVLHPYDDGWEPYWLDTITIPENQTVRFAFVADNPGRWLVGSGILERLDTGLSAWFEVG